MNVLSSVLAELVSLLAFWGSGLLARFMIAAKGFKDSKKSKPLGEFDLIKRRVAEMLYEEWREAAEDQECLELNEEFR